MEAKLGLREKVYDLAPHTDITGARCHPGLVPSLLGVPASELLNRLFAN